MPRILLVDDEPNILSSLRRCIAAMPWAAGGVAQIESFDSPLAALRWAEDHAVDLVVSDYRMPDLDGVGFLEKLLALQPDVARIILSGYADMSAVIGAINRVQIFRFVSKPWEDVELSTAMQQALEHRRLLLDNAWLADRVRLQRGQISRHEMALRRLEQRYPGLTRVNRAPDGSIDLDLHVDQLGDFLERAS
jgi:two-component system, probable response regulator PhcQ